MCIERRTREELVEEWESEACLCGVEELFEERNKSEVDREKKAEKYESTRLSVDAEDEYVGDALQQQMREVKDVEGGLLEEDVARIYSHKSNL